MSNKIQTFWDKTEKNHAGKRHGLYRLNELHNIPKTPGLYSWHLQATSLNISEYYKIFKQKRVNVQIKGNLKERYNGDVPSAFYDKDFIGGSNLDFELCEFASLAFSPPLYIGISVNLGQRLNQHFKELDKIYQGKVKLKPPTELGRTDFDTIVESSHFAQRIGFTVAKMKSIKMSSFYIKTIELDSGYSWSDIQKVEKYLNRTFIPIYGRR